VPKAVREGEHGTISGQARQLFGTALRLVWGPPSPDPRPKRLTSRRAFAPAALPPPLPYLVTQACGHGAALTSRPGAVERRHRSRPSRVIPCSAASPWVSPAELGSKSRGGRFRAVVIPVGCGPRSAADSANKSPKTGCGPGCSAGPRAVFHPPILWRSLWTLLSQSRQNPEKAGLEKGCPKCRHLATHCLPWRFM
jgi:hypothetical protein